jgi:hypothetical protein
MLNIGVYGFASTPASMGSCPEGMSPPLANFMQSTEKAKINLGYDIWSPYIYVDEGLASSTGDITGFGIEFVKLMQQSDAPECKKLDIKMVQDQWDRMWYDHKSDTQEGGFEFLHARQRGSKLGDGVNYGIYHAGMTYTHLKGLRPRMGEFSNAITKPTAQPAGILVKLDSDGKPMVSPTSDLSGETIVDVVGYAPTTDTLSVVNNWCNGGTFFNADAVNWVYPTEEGNAAAMALFKSSDAKLMYVYADQPNDCKGANFAADSDCNGWEGLGTEYALLHGGLSANINGTTIGFTKTNSGVSELLNPCIQSVMKTAEYYEICKAPLRPPDQMSNNLAVCYPNSYWSAEDMAAAEPTDLFFNQAERTPGGSCATGYCTCSEGARRS